MAREIKRTDNRSFTCLRSLNIKTDICEYADGSVIFQLGKTKVLCTVTIQPGLPAFLRGQQTGWLTAEYAMLPTATQTRRPREISVMKRNGRSVEISRVIGRTLRTVIDLSQIPDKTITVDCDVIQADGGTRAASISGAYVALRIAEKKMLSRSIIHKPFLKDSIGAVSVGVNGSTILLDPDFQEDSMMDADFNFIVTGSGKLIEIQGGAEKNAISWDYFEQVRSCALLGLKQLFDQVQKVLNSDQSKSTDQQQYDKEKRVALFSLQNRMHKS